MGYETKLYIAEVRHDIHQPFEMDEYCFWMHVIGSIDLSKAGYNTHTGNLISKQKTDVPVVFMYDIDGDTPVFLDMYDEPMGVVSIPDMIEALSRDIEDGGGSPYRRFVIARDMLLSVMDHFDTNTTFVVTYGH